MSKTIVITGASSGIGEATAKMLAANNYNVVLGARRENRLKEICDDINKENKGKAIYQVTDVTKQDEVASLINKAVSEFGKVDVLLNNAGMMPNTPLMDNDFETWDKCIDTNMKGTLYGIGAVLPIMKKQKDGQIINISSVWGHTAPATWAVYCGTKWAVRAISESLRQEVSPLGIRVTVVSPGAVDTEISTAIKDKKVKDAVDHGNKTMAISPNDVALTIKQAIELPKEAAWNEVIIRPVDQLN